MIRGKAGDTAPKQVTLRRGRGVIDLTGAQGVSYSMKQRPGTGVVTGSAVIVSPASAGKVQFPLPGAGRWDIDWTITDSGGQTETVPNVFPDVLIVRA